MQTREPRSSLRPFVDRLWSADETPGAGAFTPAREHVLPTARMHLVVRLGGDPLRLFAADNDLSGHVVGTAVVGGARSSYYIREVSQPLHSVGAVLLPGAAFALFGARADELAGRHTALDALWSASEVDRLRTRLAAARSHAERLDVFETMLAARMPRVHGLHPAVAQGLYDIRASRPVQDVVGRSGYSHRGFVALFLRAVGLTPKRYARVVRFQRALRRAAGVRNASWADIAAEAGYSDQAHLSREFLEFTGVTPSRYRAASPRSPQHLPVGGGPRRWEP